MVLSDQLCAVLLEAEVLDQVASRGPCRMQPFGDSVLSLDRELSGAVDSVVLLCCALGRTVFTVTEKHVKGSTAADPQYN